MIAISLDTKPVSDALGAMIRRIDHFKRVDIGQGLSDFQTDDMHRGRPFTMRSRAKGNGDDQDQATLALRNEAGRKDAAARRAPVFAKSPVFPRRWRAQYLQYSSRPILRSEMYEVLETRMKTLLDERSSLGQVMAVDFSTLLYQANAKRVCARDHDHADRLQSWRAGIHDARHL